MYHAHTYYPQEKWPTLRMDQREGALDLGNGAVAEKMPQIFLPLLPAECVTAFSRRTDAPEVRCDLTERQTDSPRCACAPRVNDIVITIF